jgi:galactose mutarotase-like enzyme
MARPRPLVEERSFRGEPALVMTAGELSATFLPGLGMTGVSLRYRRREYLALPGGLPALRDGKTMGLPLLAPWANRLSSRRFRIGRVDVDLTGVPLKSDPNGLPIHGLLVGAPGWDVGRRDELRSTVRLQAGRELDAARFPFPHRIELTVTVGDGRLTVDTTILPTGRRQVPVAFGWHPYLRLPGAPRGQWRLRLPTRTHLVLDAMGLPTGAAVPEPAEAEPIGRRRFDDLYRLDSGSGAPGGRARRLAFEVDGGAAVELRNDAGYPYAQVWVPAGRPFAALEPMAAPTNALVDGSTPMVRPGEAFTARFELRLRAP